MNGRIRVALLATALTGVAVAVMPRIPAAIRDLVALAALAAWLVAIGYAGAGILRRLRPSWPVVIGCSGVGVAVLAAVQLELIRLLGGRPALIWNVDWRFHLSHSRAIARTGDLSQALDYAGVPIAYHVGPAWLAAAAARVLHVDPTLVLFGLVPLLSMLAFAIAAVQLLRALGVRGDAALAATGVTMTLPALVRDPLTVYYAFPEGILNADYWVFSPSLMLNSLLALAAGMAALALIADPRSGRGALLAGAAALAAVVILKPPYFVGLGLFAGLVGLDRLRRGADGERGSARILLASLGALVLAFLMLVLLPHGGLFFGGPELAPGATGVGFGTALRNTTVLLAVLVALWAVLPAAVRGAVPHRARRAMLAAGAGLLGVVLCLALVLVPVRPEVLARVRAMGAEEWDAKHEHRELRQSLLPLDVLVVLSASGLLAMAALALARNQRQGLGVLAGLVVLSPVPLLVYQAAHPERGYEAVEDRALLDLLRGLPDDPRLTIASDLADPAEDYRRPLRGLQLSALTGRPYYASVLAYAHFVEPDARARLDTLRMFFGSGWSPWHAEWLAARGIGTVLVHDRCAAAWLGGATPGLEPVRRAGGWSAFQLEPARFRHAGNAAPARAEPPEEWSDNAPAYGRSECLRWREHG